jgi:hypothetical protein
MTAAFTFAATFALVLALAAQSLNTNQGHYRAAFFTSWIIGLMQLYVLKTLPLSTDLLIDLAYLAGGPFGAMAAMWIHPRTIGKKKRGRSGNINCGADRP